MKKMTNWEELQWRGLVKDVAGDDIADKINGEPITFYWGTDPTADSLHLGHYSSLVTAMRLMKMGHHPILLCGGATGRIGDPRPTAEREIISFDTIKNNIEGIKKQVDKIHKTHLIKMGFYFRGFVMNKVDKKIFKTKVNIDNHESTLAIVGPKRMEYDRVVGMLEYIKENLVQIII